MCFLEFHKEKLGVWILLVGLLGFFAVCMPPFTNKLNYLTCNSNDKFTNLNGKNKNWNAKGVKLKHLINDGM